MRAEAERMREQLFQARIGIGLGIGVGLGIGLGIGMGCASNSSRLG